MAMSAICRTRSIDSDSSIESKRPFGYYIKLESESSLQSNDDTESVYSIQEKETDFAKDTTDTESKTDDEYEVEIEYEVASPSSHDEGFFIDSTSDSENEIFIAAAICASPTVEKFITDAEDSDNSPIEDIGVEFTDLRNFELCIQCKSRNNNPKYRFCDKCYQDRKTFFPPRPRRHKKNSKSSKPTALPVKLDALQSCLKGLSQEACSQDSGVGSSQEFPSLCLDQIVVPKRLSAEVAPETPCTSSSLPQIGTSGKSRKRQISESSLSEFDEPKPKKSKPSKVGAEEEEEEKKGETLSTAAAVTQTTENCSVRTASDSNLSLPEVNELCIMCSTKPKNGIFLHGRIAHMCCCYRCAMRTWKSVKRCPICNRKVNNVVRVYTS